MRYQISDKLKGPALRRLVEIYDQSISGNSSFGAAVDPEIRLKAIYNSACIKRGGNVIFIGRLLEVAAESRAKGHIQPQKTLQELLDDLAASVANADRVNARTARRVAQIVELLGRVGHTTQPPSP